jgi:hypothetical protein
MSYMPASRVNGDAYFWFLWIDFFIVLDNTLPVVVKIFSVLCLIEHLMEHIHSVLNYKVLKHSKFVRNYKIF